MSTELLESQCSQPREVVCCNQVVFFLRKKSIFKEDGVNLEIWAGFWGGEVLLLLFAVGETFLTGNIDVNNGLASVNAFGGNRYRAKNSRKS